MRTYVRRLNNHNLWAISYSNCVCPDYTENCFSSMQFFPQKLACMASYIECSHSHSVAYVHTNSAQDSKHLRMQHYYYHVAPCALIMIQYCYNLYQSIQLWFTCTSCSILEASNVCKQENLNSLCSLAGCDSDRSCTVNSDCTCVSFTPVANVLITIPLTICIVDPCAIPVCFMITSESLFTRTVCKDSDIDFKMNQTLPVSWL